MTAITESSQGRFSRFFELMAVVHKLYHANPANTPRKMDISSHDVQRLLESLNKHQVRYLLVGGMASVLHGHVRATADMDLWIQKDVANMASLIAALRENEVAGAELLKDMPLVFGWTSVQVGRNGFTLDLGHSLKAFTEADFDTCYARAVDAQFDGIPFKVIHLTDLLIEKRATGRAKDLLDVEELSKLAGQAPEEPSSP